MWLVPVQTCSESMKTPVPNTLGSRKLKSDFHSA